MKIKRIKRKNDFIVFNLNVYLPAKLKHKKHQIKMDTIYRAVYLYEIRTCMVRITIQHKTKEHISGYVTYCVLFDEIYMKRMKLYTNNVCCHIEHYNVNVIVSIR